MIKRITDLINLIVSIVKARWVFILVYTGIISVLVWLRDLLFMNVEINSPVIFLIFIATLSLYPIWKFIGWVLDRSEVNLVEFRGLLWKPSRLGFIYPTPLCKQCKSKIFYQTKYKSFHLIQGLQDIEDFEENSVKHIFECPNHGILQIPNESIEHLQKLAKLKIDS